MAEESPVPRRPREPSLPERRLTSTELEAVIARAIELQSHEEARLGDEGIGETELVRIAGELGISAAHVQQAIAEVRARPLSEQGLLTRLFGPAYATATRALPIPAARARDELERYLEQVEAMVVQRRMGERMIFERGAGVGAAMSRTASRMSARHPLLGARLVEVAVSAVDERSCHASISMDLHAQRSAAVGGTAAGGVMGGAAGVALATAVAPPLALVAVPIFAVFSYASQASYRSTREKTQVLLESVLDRLAHGELIDRGPPGLLRRFGL